MPNNVKPLRVFSFPSPTSLVCEHRNAGPTTHGDDGQQHEADHQPHGTRGTDFMSVCTLWARLHVEPARLHVGAPAFFFLLGFLGISYTVFLSYSNCIFICILCIFSSQNAPPTYIFVLVMFCKMFCPTGIRRNKSVTKLKTGVDPRHVVNLEGQL
jgi:hypothetical protein